MRRGPGCHSCWLVRGREKLLEAIPDVMRRHRSCGRVMGAGASAPS